MKIEKFIPTEFAANNYLLYDEFSKDAVLIDCAGSKDEIFKYIEENGLNLKYILITHAHFDHVGSLKDFKEKYTSVQVLLPEGDKLLYDGLSLQCDLFGVPKVAPIKIDEYIEEGKVVEISSSKITMISTPGHSRGSSCYLTDGVLFSGDTLFFEEIGRCDLPTGSFEAIERSIKEKLFVLDENIKVFTGHGDNTTIGHEKINNAYFGVNAIYS